MSIEACIETTDAKNEHGYGHVRHEGKVVRSHRLAYAQAHGLQLSDLNGVIVRHACDNRACINPAHLVLGTQADNMHDMAARGRNRQPKGERNAKAKLTEAAVVQIRARLANGDACREIALDYGVCNSQISRISTRKTWSHVQ